MAAANLWNPVKASGSHFYKYSEFSGERRGWLRDIILTHRLYIPNLPQLNDPSDGRPKLAQMTEDELFTFYYNGPGGVLARNPRMSIEDQIKEGLILDYNLRHHGTEAIMRDTAKVLNKELEGWRIYCLCKRGDSLSMWMNYAGGHTGYCLEFANAGPFFSDASEVSYGEPLNIEIAQREQLDGRWFFRKKLDFSYEEEVRILRRRGSDCWVTIDPTWMTRLILGWKMSEADRNEIRTWAAHRSPALKVVEASWDDLDQVLRLGN